MSSPLYRRVESRMSVRSQRGRSLADTGRDYANKSWLRRPRLRERIVEFLQAIIILALVLFALASILQAIDAHAGQHWIALLDDARYPATLDEGQAAYPEHGRPLYCISHQERSNEPWNHRFCTYGQ